jgi:hypothetical protein
MGTKISELKQQTDAYLHKHPIDSQYALSDAVLSDFLTEICKSAAKGKVDDIEELIGTVYHYGYMQGCKQSKGSSMVDRSVPGKDKYKELAAVLANYETK